MNENELMRSYANILADKKKKVVKESIEQGMLEVVEKRLNKTMGMINDLAGQLIDDAPETVAALNELATNLSGAVLSIQGIQASWDSEMDMVDAPVDTIEPEIEPPMDALADPMIDPTEPSVAPDAAEPSVEEF